MAEVKSCIACNRPMAVKFDACPFCQAVQPQRSIDHAREIKCEKCARRYSTKLAACPFCAKEGSAKEIPAKEIETPPPRREDVRADAEAKETGVWLKLGALAAIVVLTAFWSLASSIGGDRLGDESSGLFGPCLFAGVVLAVGTAFLFHRWTDGQALPITGIVAAAMIIPWTGTSYGMAKWLNAAGIDEREQPIDCILTSKHHERSRRGADLGWVYRYRCTVEGGQELNGSYHDYGIAPRVGVETGEPIRMTAARGRLGIWLRRSDPITPPRS